MIRVVLVLIIATSASLTASAQLQLSASAGYGFFSMSEMKDFQEELRQSMGHGVRVTSSYPAYWVYDVGLHMTLRKGLFIGGSLNYGSTGGRVHYSDYSGEVGSDQRLKFFGFTSSIGSAVPLSEDKTWRLILDVKPGLQFTYLDITAFSRIGDTGNSDKLKLSSSSLTVEPTVTVQRRFGRVGAQAAVGYHVTAVPGKLYQNVEGDLYLINNDGDAVHASWTGLRVSLGGYFLLTHVAD
jgi:hypothetical protein